MSFNKWKMALRASIFGSLFLGAALALSSVVYAVQPPQSPDYLVSADSSVSGFTLTLNGHATSTKQQADQFHVYVTWGDGLASTTVSAPFAALGNQQGFDNVAWSASHDYTTSGPKTVTVKLYHGNINGAEATGDATITVSVVIPPNPEDTLAECSDTLDNDTDGLADLLDPGCVSFRPVLTVVKTVTNDNGRTAVASDFTMNVTGAVTTSFAGSAGTAVTFTQIGAYSVTETANADYTVSYSADCNGSMAVGDTKTCTVTNDDKPTTGTIQVVKNVVASDLADVVDSTLFTVTLDGGSNTQFGEALAAIFSNLLPGDYTIAEIVPSGYALVSIDDTTPTVVAGMTTTVHIVNRQLGTTGTLTVVKVVDNDGNENATKEFPSDFNLYVDETPVDSGEENTFSAGNHTVTEDAVDGYQASWSENCPEGVIAVPVEGEATCTLTNTWVGTGVGTLTVTKVVVGGDLAVDDFDLSVDETPVVSGEENEFVAGLHTITESTEANDEYYVASWSENCPNGVANVVSDETVTCTLTNTYTPPTTGTVVVTKNVIAKDRQTDVADNTTFTITLTKGEYSTSSAFAEGAPATFAPLEPGVYDVSEGENGSYEIFEIPETVEVWAGEVSNITITNRQLGTTGGLVIEKNVLDENGEEIQDGTSFTVVLGGEESVSVAEGAPAVFYEMALGSYSVSENSAEGYELVSIVPSVAEVNLSGTTTVVVTNRKVAAPQGGGDDDDGNSGSRRGGRRRGSVLGASTGDVLGASTDSCELYIDEYLKFGWPNNPVQVEKLQTFLNEQIGANLPVTGVFGPLTYDAVKRFQEANGPAILGPWVAAGFLPSDEVGTGFVYKTTRWFINHVKCEELAGNTPLVP